MKTTFKTYKGKLCLDCFDNFLEYNVSDNSYGNESLINFLNTLAKENEGKLAEIHIVVEIED